MTSPLLSPRSIGSDPEAVGLETPCEALLCAAHSSSESIRFTQALRRKLLLKGVNCSVPMTEDIGGVKWRREIIKYLKRTSIFLCIISDEWIRSGVSWLTLYYALRRSYVCDSPVILPIILDEHTTLQHPLVQGITKQLFHIIYDPTISQPLSDLVTRVKNFLVALQYKLPDKIITGRIEQADGTFIPASTYSDVYRYYYLKYSGGKMPKKGILKKLSDLTETDTSLDLSDDLSSKPPAVYFIGDNGVRALVEVVKLLPNLKKINLSGNGLSSSVVHPLVSALVSHPSVVSLNISENSITQVSATELYYLLRTNEQITELDISKTNISSEVWIKRIAAQLVRNKKSIFGSWTSVPKQIDQQDEHYNPPPRIELQPRLACRWDVVIICKPQDDLETTSLWTEDSTSVLINISVAGPNLPSKLTLQEELQSGSLEKKDVLSYIKEVDSNTCCIKKMNGNTIKLVLENQGQGLESLQYTLRLMALRKKGWNQNLIHGLQRISVRLSCQKPKRCRQKSFFVDCEIWYSDAGRISKSVPQLYREDITKYVSSFRLPFRMKIRMQALH